ncbi:flagellar hook-basal body protein [Sporolactobacillus sp. THM7-4]|nr:flagellar hook-basal body protein [Sporolactobacillus sp. THM7-4]
MKLQMTATAATLGQIQQELATVANNLANVGTTGFKNRTATFNDLLVQQMNNIGAKDDPLDQSNRLTPAGIRRGSGSRVGDTQPDMALGPLKETGNALDLALTDDHQFFEVGYTGPGGRPVTAYTRDGSFHAQPDPQNPNQVRLVTQSGQSVLDRGGRPIVLPAGSKEIQIDRQGVITAIMPNDRRVAAGQLGLVTVNRPQLLENQGDNLYILPNPAQLGLGANQVLQPVATNAGSIEQGKLENSNVDITKEMVSLVNLEHNYQLNARSITMGDQMAGLVNGLLR